MNILSLVVVFTIIWWLVLFMVLPVGLNSGVNSSGAPVKPKLKKKLLITTMIAAGFSLLIYLLVEFELLNLRPYFDTL